MKVYKNEVTCYRSRKLTPRSEEFPMDFGVISGALSTAYQFIAPILKIISLIKSFI